MAELIAWWIDQDTGYPFPSGPASCATLRSQRFDSVGRQRRRTAGQVRQSRSSDRARGPDQAEVADVHRSKAHRQPRIDGGRSGIPANLKALPAVEQARLLGGNWKIRPAAGLYFRREWCQIVDAAPAGAQVVRYWDLAATVKTESNDPDWTVGVKLAETVAPGGFAFCMRLDCATRRCR